jgi:hypothetical protein
MAQTRYVYFLCDPFDEEFWIIIARSAKEARAKLVANPGQKGKNPKFFALRKVSGMEITTGTTRVVCSENYKFG